MQKTLVRVTALTHRYGRRTALSGVDLMLDRGEVLGLLGPNGAGKTTCLRLLAGLLAPHDGRIEILGADLARRPRAARAHLGYLPERPPLYPELRVDEYLTFCARLRRIPSGRRRAAIDEVKQRCGLADSGRQLIATLSRGFRQRLGIAQAIIHRPPLVILDEPTEGLDPVQMRELRALIRGLVQDEDRGVILSSHLLPEVQAVCDRVTILHEGRVRHDGRLERDPAVPAWTARLGGDQDEALNLLKALPGVADVAAAGDDRYRVRLAPGTGSDTLARGIVGAGLPLRELVPERGDLERTFFDLIGAAEAMPCS